MIIIAKDGTNRGGPRPGLGRPKKPLAEKIREGKASGTLVLSDALPVPSELKGDDVPKVSDYMKAKQKDGSYLCAEKVFVETYRWLKARGCENYVSKQLIEQYAMSVARWIQCEEAISDFGYLAKHPTTGNAIASPFVSMSRDYKKQLNADWYQIYQIVKENCSVEYGGSTPQDDMMDRLLKMRLPRRNQT